MFDRFAALRSASSLVHKYARRLRAWAALQWRDPARRDRVQAAATCAIIGAFTLASIDYLICGGMDWNPGGEAYAMEIAPPRTGSAALAAAPAPLAPPARVTTPSHPGDHAVFVQELLGGPGPLAPAEDMSAPDFPQFKGMQQTRKTALPH